MTARGRQLLNEAKRDYWKKGVPIPLDMFVEMVAEGIDALGLEARYLEIN
jgi:hypothetical protein